MENLSHSRPPNKSSTSVYKKSCNGTNVMTKTSYDDVFGGPPKFGAPTLAPRVEDYTEIFGGFHAPRASSIPVLDLPVVDEEDVFFDVRSSGFDYNEVFGGFDGLDCAISLEELVMDQSNGLCGDVDSCDDAWTPAESDSLSEESDMCGKNQSLCNRDSYESIDGSMEFKVSFHKANQRSDEDLPNGITHVTQIHAVPGYTVLVDKITPLEKAYYENPPLEVTDDSNLHMDFGGGMMREKNLKKTLSQPSDGSSGVHAFANSLKSQRPYGRNSSLPIKPFVTVSEISLRTQPSEGPPPCRPAPLLDISKGDSSKRTKNCKTNASEGIMGDASPPFYDVEVDAGSSAAASAAAMKEVVEKAQAKLKTAKELLERKREGVQSLKHDRKKEGKLFGTVEGSSSIKAERVPGQCERQANGMTFTVMEDRQKDSKTMKAVPDSLEGENVLNVDKTLVGKHGRSGKFVEAGEWKEETEFFELVKTDRSTFEQAKDDEVLGLDANFEDCRRMIKKGAMEAVDHQRVNGQTTETNSEYFKLGENEKNLKVAKESCELSESYRRSGASSATGKHKGQEKRVKVAQQVGDLVEEKKYRVVQHSAEIVKKSSEPDVPEKHGSMVKVQHNESRFEGECSVKHLENEQPLRETNRSLGNESTFKGPCDMSAGGRRQREAVVLIENEKRVKEALVQEDKERMIMGVFEQKENEKKMEAYVREESERKIKEALEKIESEKRLEKGFDQEKNEKEQRDARQREDNEKRLKEALEKEEQEIKQKETSEREETARRFKEICDIEKMEKKLKEARENEETGKSLGVVCEQVDSCETLKEAQGRLEESEMRAKEAFEKEESRNMSKEARVETEKRVEDAGEAGGLKELNGVHDQNQWEEYGKKLKMAEGPGVFKEEDLIVTGKACVLDDNENLQGTQLAGQHEENNKKGDVSQGAFSYEGNVEILVDYSDVEKEATVTTTNVLADRESEVLGRAQDNLKQEEYSLKMKGVAEVLCEDRNVKTIDESGTGIGQEKNTSCLLPDSDAENEEKNFSNESGERENNVKRSQVDVGLNPKLDKEKFMPTQLGKEYAQNGRKMEAVQQSMLEGKRNIQNTSLSVNASQHSERKQKSTNEMLEDKEAERMRQERELEIERLRRMEEEREREREREKDRMAVDLATLEARERAYGEARERAERAAVERASSEVRQRALAEARERLEKACAEAKEKSLAEKAHLEARIRSERAAVERATAEARERAVEKAMAERAAFEARERLDRTFSEKFSASSRNSAMRPSSSSSDLQEQKFQSASSLSNTSYPYSSASYNAERSDGIEGESAQRCKARLERHRRTAERAAKALAEKNMRDLLTQREQAERNRLAETLDADVKRWSSGKEGNLRALLSTLQYILGSDSGWHPIPLTEVITSAAVKKAYRKATLCVHPDKLQQRGASIQQKYICEKVFDLLKEAWNKFNSEER